MLYWGVHHMRCCSAPSEIAMESWVLASSWRGGGDGVANGGASISDLGKIRMLSREQFSGANMTNFAVCRITACCGWDEATMTLHPMGKLTVDGDSDRTGMVGTWSWGACCATMHATACARCALLNARWIVQATTLVFSRRWKN